MKHVRITLLLLLTSLGTFAQTEELSPEELVQQQLDGYNARDIDLFLAPYSDSVEIYSFPNRLDAKGKENIRPGYASMFENSPKLHCELVNRIVNGNMVIDRERVTGLLPKKKVLEAVAIYIIENGKIQKVYFPDSIITKEN